MWQPDDIIAGGRDDGSSLIPNVRQPSLLIGMCRVGVQHCQCTLHCVRMDLESASFSSSFQFLDWMIPDKG